MTIREHLKRKRRRFFLIALPAWLAFALGGATQRLWIVIPAFLVFMACAIAQFFIFRCLICGGNVSTIELQTGGWSFGGRKPQFCPFCAANLDSEIPE